MITLRQLLKKISYSIESGNKDLLDVRPEKITCDSRTVSSNDLFVAIEGETTDGHLYIKDAADKKCLAIIIEKKTKQYIPDSTLVISVDNSRYALGILAAASYGFPSEEMTLIGITGTNGKTTTSWIIEKLLQGQGLKSGVIGTVNYRYTDSNSRVINNEASFTTPEPLKLHKLLREMADNKVSHVIMEVSSHALIQKRVAGLTFQVAVFTNLSRDHLDFHGSMENYFKAKQKLFSQYLAPNGVAVVVENQELQNHDLLNRNNNWENILISNLLQEGFIRNNNPVADKKIIITCGLKNGVNIQAIKPHITSEGLSCEIELNKNKYILNSCLTGLYNVFNLLASIGTGLALNISDIEIIKAISSVTHIPGRLERVHIPGKDSSEKGPTIFVDFAHSPDSLENVLKNLRQLTKGRLISVFGCGGDRDKGKRPLMGAISAKLADITIITTDNPRSEDPDQIINDIKQGLFSTYPRAITTNFINQKTVKKGYLLIRDRKEAIATACYLANQDDTIIIAGKGHETYQLIGKEKHFFDDRIEALNALLCWNLYNVKKATGGMVLQGKEKSLWKGISTDTRTLCSGDIFIAIRGEKFDGHDHVDSAINKGAAAIIAQRPVFPQNKDIPVILVNDTIAALGNLAKYRRGLLGPNLKVIAITGSSGKTTVKEITAAIFRLWAEKNNLSPGSILVTKGNYNNLIGLPLSLLPVNGGHKIAILEMGMNQPGEISRLTEIADPDIGCITNIQAAHLEGLGTIENVSRAKGELFKTMHDHGIRILNFDNKFTRKLTRFRPDIDLGFSAIPKGKRFKPTVYASHIKDLGEEGMRFTLHIRNWRKRLSIQIPGMHNVNNCVAASTIAAGMGVDNDTICSALEGFSSFSKRMELDILQNGIKLVNDTYNANPSSMSAALKTVSGFGKNCQRVALLADMLELGDDAAKAHYEIGALTCKLGYDYLAVTGQYATNLANGAREAGMEKDRVCVCDDKKMMFMWVNDLIRNKKIKKDDWMLLKGSRGMQMDLLLEMLKGHQNIQN